MIIHLQKHHLSDLKVIEEKRTPLNETNADAEENKYARFARTETDCRADSTHRTPNRL